MEVSVRELKEHLSKYLRLSAEAFSQALVALHVWRFGNSSR